MIVKILSFLYGAVEGSCQLPSKKGEAVADEGGKKKGPGELSCRLRGVTILRNQIFVWASKQSPADSTP